MSRVAIFWGCFGAAGPVEGTLGHPMDNPVSRRRARLPAVNGYIDPHRNPDSKTGRTTRRDSRGREPRPELRGGASAKLRHQPHM